MLGSRLEVPFLPTLVLSRAVEDATGVGSNAVGKPPFVEGMGVHRAESIKLERSSGESCEALEVLQFLVILVVLCEAGIPSGRSGVDSKSREVQEDNGSRDMLPVLLLLTLRRARDECR